MKLNRSISHLLQRKLATLLLVTASMAAFASLGEGEKKDIPRSTQKLLSARSASVNYKSFTLRSGYNYRGNNLLHRNTGHNYILLNKTITVEKGNQTYILPMKRKVLLDRINFRASSLR